MRTLTMTLRRRLTKKVPLVHCKEREEHIVIRPQVFLEKGKANG